MLQPINDSIRNKLNLNQFQSTKQVISWFKQRDSSRRASFTTFDVESFYPSITQDLVIKSLRWASSVTPISDVENETIVAACNNLLFTGEGVWLKTNSELHDITMGSYCGAEVCKLVGLYMFCLLYTSPSPRD